MEPQAAGLSGASEATSSRGCATKAGAPAAALEVMVRVIFLRIDTGHASAADKLCESRGTREEDFGFHEIRRAHTASAQIVRGVLEGQA